MVWNAPRSSPSVAYIESVDRSYEGATRTLFTVDKTVVLFLALERS